MRGRRSSGNYYICFYWLSSLCYLSLLSPLPPTWKHSVDLKAKTGFICRLSWLETYARMWTKIRTEIIWTSGAAVYLFEFLSCIFYSCIMWLKIDLLSFWVKLSTFGLIGETGTFGIRIGQKELLGPSLTDRFSWAPLQLQITYIIELLMHYPTITNASAYFFIG